MPKVYDVTVTQAVWEKSLHRVTVPDDVVEEIRWVYGSSEAAMNEEVEGWVDDHLADGELLWTEIEDSVAGIDTEREIEEVDADQLIAESAQAAGAEQRRRAAIDRAREAYKTDDLEIDEDARVSEGEDGLWVQAWVRVVEEGN